MLGWVFKAKEFLLRAKADSSDRDHSIRDLFWHSKLLQALDFRQSYQNVIVLAKQPAHNMWTKSQAKDSITLPIEKKIVVPISETVLFSIPKPLLGQ